MRAYEFITEGRNHPVIVVDVQPEYCGIADGNENPTCVDIIKFVANQTGPVLMFVNAEQTGVSIDSLEDILHYWEETLTDYDSEEITNRPLGVPPPSPINWNRFEIVDKGYGYFRNWMGDKSDSTIIKVIREMYRQRVSQSSELFGSRFDNKTNYDNGMRELMGNEYEPSDVDDIYVNWTSVAQLKRFSGAYLVGGGRKECLREVELLMNAFNMRYKRIDSLVYG